MKEIVAAGSLQILDARPADRFAGEAPEPRAGVRAGHMPGAHSLPFLQLAENGRLKSPEELRKAFADAGVDPDKPVGDELRLGRHGGGDQPGAGKPRQPLLQAL